MFKRIFSVILIISMLFTMICVFAEDESVFRNENAVKLVEKLEIVFPKNSAEYDSEITRADFVVYAARILGIDDSIRPGETRYYIDMAMYDYAAYSANCFVEKGILSVPDDKMFRPGDPITLGEAAKIAVCMLGYKPVSETKGGYPNGYLWTAKQLGLLDDVSKGVNNMLTLNDAICIFYECLTAPQYIVDYISVDGDDSLIGYTVSPENTLIYEAFGYKFKKGVLTGYDGINIAYDTVAGDECAVVDGVLYRVSSDLVLTNFLGRTVCALVDDNDTIVHAYCEPKGEVVTEIDIRDFAGYDGKSLTYNYGDNKTKTVDVSQAVVIYNEDIPANGNKELFNSLESGVIEVIDYNGDGKTDAVIVKDYHAYVFNSIDPVKNTIYADNLILDLSGYEKVTILDENKNAIEISDLEEDWVLNIMAAKDKSRITILISDEDISGTVEQTFSGNEFRAKIGGKLYAVNKRHSSIQDKIKPGQTATFLINAFGEIIAVTDGTRDGFSVGFLNGINIDGVFNKELKICLFTKNDGIKVYDVAETVRVDGIRYKDAENAVNSIPDASCEAGKITAFKSQMILYKTNADGKITDIDTHYTTPGKEDPNMTLQRVYDGATQIKKLSSDRLDRTLPVTGSTDFYCVPPEDKLSADPELYKVQKQGSFNTMVTFNFECYKIKGENEFVDLVIHHLDPGNTADKDNLFLNSHMFLVHEKIESIDSDMNKFITVEGLMQGGKSSIQIYPDKLDLVTGISVDDFEEGDLIRFIKDKGGRIIEIQKLYDVVDGITNSWAGVTTTETLFNSTYTNHFQLSFGYANQKGEKTVSWGYKDGSSIDEIADLSKVTCMYYDGSLADGNRVYTGGIDGIVDYKTVRDTNKCDIVIVQMKQGSIMSVVVYKR